MWSNEPNFEPSYDDDDGADASFELLARRIISGVPRYISISEYDVSVKKDASGEIVSSAKAQLEVDGEKIICEGVGNGPVNAGGYRVNEVAKMMNVHHPVASMEHQYFLTEDIPEIENAGHRMPLLRCPISDYYCRQDKNGLLIGFYEQDCKPWGMDGIDPNFVNALCPDDLDRVTDVLEGAFARMPALKEAVNRIKTALSK